MGSEHTLKFTTKQSENAIKLQTWLNVEIKFSGTVKNPQVPQFLNSTQVIVYLGRLVTWLLLTNKMYTK